MGAGFEFGGGYEKCQLEFMGIENIHEMRKCYQVCARSVSPLLLPI